MVVEPSVIVRTVVVHGSSHESALPKGGKGTGEVERGASDGSAFLGPLALVGVTVQELVGLQPILDPLKEPVGFDLCLLDALF